MPMKKVLITGANGQLAKELARTAPKDYVITSFSREQLDLSKTTDIEACVAALRPNIVINAAAYTAVDKAESEPSQAQKVNADAVRDIAQAVDEACYFLHISTDFVFDGESNRPYKPSDLASPGSVYGSTKHLGESLLFETKPSNSAVIRTSWVYSSHGKNFVNSMLRFMAERSELSIVVDQLGTPTWAKGLAEVCWQACDQSLEGLFHWSDAGVASWYDFAVAIQRIAIEKGILTTKAELNAIPTEAYPLPAKRPAYSVLDKSEILSALPDLKNKHWYDQLVEMFNEYELKS